MAGNRKMEKNGKCRITENMVEDYKLYLTEGEKSRATIEKYIRNIRKLMAYAMGRRFDKDTVLAYKESLMEGRKYKVSSINSMLIDINQFLEHQGWYEFRVKTYKVQKSLFYPENKYLSKEEYERLLQEARRKGKLRLYFLLETLASTGMRVSELSFLTVEAVREGSVVIYCKGKVREILLPPELQRQLLLYAEQKEIQTGIVFRTRSGNAVNRSNVWREMKNLCEGAGVNPEKVFPHNLRHLFAQCFYKERKDLAELASVMGHSSVETTRLYLLTTGKEYRKELEKMDMVLPLGDIFLNSGCTSSQASLKFVRKEKNACKKNLPEILAEFDHEGSTRNRICCANGGCAGNQILAEFDHSKRSTRNGICCANGGCAGNQILSEFDHEKPIAGKK